MRRRHLDAPAWRDALLGADYTPDGVLALLGPAAHAALTRGETVPAERLTRGGSSLETLVRLFLLQRPVPATSVPLPLEEALAAGVVRGDGPGLVRAGVDLRPYDRAGWWVVSDLGTGLDGRHRPLPTDHVLGVGGASTTLAELTVRPQVARALDVGTGSGVQALHLAEHSGHVTATDLSPRALAMAGASAALSGVEVDLREGSLLEPVRGETFDLVVSNPPFVVSWGAPESSPSPRYTYRDSGMAGDDVCAALVSGAAGVVAPGGWCQLLANWVHHRGEDWRERVAGWVPPGFDAWVLQRDVQDPAAYVATWLRDSGQEGGEGAAAAYERWLEAFEAHGVDGVGFGWVTLRRSGTDAPSLQVEEWPYPVESPVGPAVQTWFQMQDTLRGTGDDDLLDLRLLVSTDVVQEQHGRPGAEDPEHLVLRQARGMRRAARVGTAEAAFVGACDGTLTTDRLLVALAEVLGTDEPALRAELLPRVRALLADGTLGIGRTA